MSNAPRDPSTATQAFHLDKCISILYSTRTSSEGEMQTCTAQLQHTLLGSMSPVYRVSQVGTKAVKGYRALWV